MTGRVRALALAATLLLALPGAAHASSWSAPFAIAAAPSLDESTPVLAVAPGGEVAIGLGTSDSDVAGSQHAQLALRTAGGRIGAARALPGAAQVLAMAWSAGHLVILEGRTSATQDCCSQVDAVTVSATGRLGAAQRIVGGLAGATTARLLTLADGRLTAVVATDRGVWTAQTGAVGRRFGTTRQIAARRQQPEAMAAAALGGERTIAAWTAVTGTLTTARAHVIDVATGSGAGAPGQPRATVRLDAGHRVDALAAGGRGGTPALAWIESWYGSHGAYHSEVEVAGLGRGTPHPRTFSAPGQIASGLSLVTDPGGDEALVWSQCTVAGTCTVKAAGRPAGGAFGAARTLGADDGTPAPAVAIAPGGRVLVAWVRSGDPVASIGFGAPTQLSSAADGSVGGLGVSFGSHGALAAWSQGTTSGAVLGAVDR